MPGCGSFRLLFRTFADGLFCGRTKPWCKLTINNDKSRQSEPKHVNAGHKDEKDMTATLGPRKIARGPHRISPQPAKRGLGRSARNQEHGWEGSSKMRINAESLKRICATPAEGRTDSGNLTDEVAAVLDDILLARRNGYSWPDIAAAAQVPADRRRAFVAACFRARRRAGLSGRTAAPQPVAAPGAAAEPTPPPPVAPPPARPSPSRPRVGELEDFG